MYFPDLDKCRYHWGPLHAGSWQVPLLSVGWLEHPHPYTRGKAPDGLRDLLQGFVSAAEVAHPQENFRGLHTCSLCEAERGASEPIEHSHVNVLIPGSSVVYAAPAGITHYIEFHSYLPPSEFIAAVSRCPAYGSAAFYEALRTANRGVQPPIVLVEEHLRDSRANFLARICEHLRPVVKLELERGNRISRVHTKTGTRSPLTIVFAEPLHRSEIERSLNSTEPVIWHASSDPLGGIAGYLCAELSHFVYVSGPVGR